MKEPDREHRRKSTIKYSKRCTCQIKKYTLNSFRDTAHGAIVYEGFRAVR